MLKNTLYKLANDKNLRIAYFGGSITEGAGASDATKTCYRALVTEYFKNKYPDCDITEIYAAIGGTGTSYGMYRVVPDVIAHSPDLTFVEFAINDYGDNYDNIRCQTETIIRKLLISNPNMDIILLFSTSEEVIEAVERGDEFDSRSAQLTAAHHYNIPTIDHGAALHAAIRKSGRPVTDFIPDTLHPGDLGYRVMTDCIIEKLEKALAEEVPQALVPHEIPSPDAPKVYDNARLVPVTSLDALNMCGFELKKAPENERFPEYLAARDGGASFSFEFEGEALGFAWVGGYCSNDLSVSIDGGEPITARSWDHALRSFHRMQNAVFAKGLPTGSHTVTVTVIGDSREDLSELCGIAGVFLC